MWVKADATAPWLVIFKIYTVKYRNSVLISEQRNAKNILTLTLPLLPTQHQLFHPILVPSYWYEDEDLFLCLYSKALKQPCSHHTHKYVPNKSILQFLFEQVVLCVLLLVSRVDFFYFAYFFSSDVQGTHDVRSCNLALR